MAILQASRIKQTESTVDRITPFVVVEEPESFLHPSAQAEFGRVLGVLASELGVQIIATTHSPYMLNHEEPEANLLLERRINRKKPFESVLVDTSTDGWMAPFSDHLGLPSDEFARWKGVVTSHKSKVLLVEGSSDKEYFDVLAQDGLACERLRSDIEIAPYGGKDTLKNTLLVQFVLRKFDQVFVTYDLDADSEIRSSLNRLGLRDGRDFVSLGRGESGKDCIEGLLPARVLAAVNGRETDLVMRLGSRDNSERRKAKEALKKKYLEEFLSARDYTKDELRELAKVVRTINSRFGDTPAVVVRKSDGAA